jgi:hypothetical protein
VRASVQIPEERAEMLITDPTRMGQDQDQVLRTCNLLKNNGRSAAAQCEETPKLSSDLSTPMQALPASRETRVQGSQSSDTLGAGSDSDEMWKAKGDLAQMWRCEMNLDIHV